MISGETQLIVKFSFAKIRMLKNGIHPEKIPESNKRLIIKIMKEGHVLGPVNDFLMNEAANVL